MANVKLRIEINSDASNEALGQISTDNMEFANTSIQPNANGVFSAFPKLSNATSGINALTYGQELFFNDKDELDNIDGFGGGLDDEENPVEVVWGIVNEDNTYNVTLTFTGATGLQNVIVYGDKESKQFPTRAILDGTKEVFSDDYAWTIEFDEPSDTHTIQFTHWNRANYNAVLTLIDIMLQNYEVDIYNGLKSVESLSQSSADTTGIFYGSIENSGSIDIMDRSGELVDLLEDGILDNANVPITVLVNGKEVQKHISTDSSYNRNSKTISIELGNRLSTLDVLKYKGYVYPDHSENLANLLFDVLSNLRYALFGEDRQLTEDEFKEMLSAKYNSNITLYDYLNSIEVQYPVIESNKTYREVIDEFCLIAQMQMYIDDNNNVRFVTARPKEFTDELNAIHIPKKNMFSQLDYAVILKNKYDGVEASKYDVENRVDYSSVVASPTITVDNLSIIEETENETLDYQDSPLGSSSYGGVVAVTYLYVKSYYLIGDVTINKSDNNNLSKILNVFDTIKKDDVYTYDNVYDYSSGSASATVKTSGSVTISGISKDLTSTEENVNKQILNDEENTYTFTSGTNSITSTSKFSNINQSSISEIIENNDNTITIKFKVLCGKLVTKMSGGTRWATQVPIVGVTNVDLTIPMSGTNEYFKPISVDISVYGNKRTITFNEVQSNTPNIETAKTKVSLNSGTLIQTDAVIDTIKNNILTDYMQGVSNASVSISCNDYFDNNGRKVINWEKGEIPQVNQVVYFDNDLYKDQTQRYWKIKSRNFRKTGVPMIDLELEETKKHKTLQDYSWSEIGNISKSGNAKYIFNIGDTKEIALSDGQTIKAQIVGFDHDETNEGKNVGITFGLTEPMSENYQMNSTLSSFWSNSDVADKYLPSIFGKLPNELQLQIKDIDKSSQVSKLWLFSVTELGLSVDDTYVEGSKYEYFNSKEKLIKNNVEYGWWTRSGTYEGSNGKYAYIDANGEAKLIASTASRQILFAFCI